MAKPLQTTTKNLVRSEMIAKRNALSFDDLYRAREAIKENLENHPYFQKAQRIAFYWPSNKEVDTLPFIKSAFLAKKALFLPKTSAEKQMIFIRIHNLDFPYKYYLNIKEPLLPTNSADAVSANELDLIICPLVAADKNLVRIGYGHGFYDRALANSHSSLKTIGLAYDFQIVQLVVSDVASHDVRLNWIVSETKLWERP